MRQLPAVHPHTPIFRTTIERRDSLARIEQHGRIERAFNGKKHLALAIRELSAHLVYFFDTDAVLTRNSAAIFNTKLQNIGGKLLGALELARNIRVEQNQRVQIAVTGMKYIRATQLVLQGKLRRAFQDR